MWITLAAAMFGALVGLCVRNRSGALFISCFAVVLAHYGLTQLASSSSIYLNASPTGRRLAAEIDAVVSGGPGALIPMMAATAAGALIAVLVTRAQGGAREWDPDRPRKRKRRASTTPTDSRIERILNS